MTGIDSSVIIYYYSINKTLLPIIIVKYCLGNNDIIVTYYHLFKNR